MTIQFLKKKKKYYVSYAYETIETIFLKDLKEVQTDTKDWALKTYDEGKYMKDAYTHHFNKVYRTQIAEL